MDFVLDFGNARIKWYDPRESSFQDCRHAVAELRESDWNKIVGRNLPPEGFIKVNGKPYAIGDAARKHTIKERPRGASRYTPDYYGVGLCYALAASFQKSTRSIDLIATHAPQDIDYAKNLVSAAKQKWAVESAYGKLDFTIRDVFTLDEPIGGFANYAFNEQGHTNKHNIKRNSDSTTLVIDIGGYTTDVVAIDPDGTIDLLSIRSTRTGVLNLVEAFEQDLRSNNQDLFFDSQTDIDPRRLEKSIMSGKFSMQREVIDCSEEAKAAKNSLVNDVTDIIKAAGGIVNYDLFLLTGGGVFLIYDELAAAMPRAIFQKSEPKQDRMRFSNAFGAHKLLQMLRVQGAI